MHNKKAFIDGNRFLPAGLSRYMLFFGVVVLFAACERPFVAPRVPEVEILEPTRLNQLFFDRDVVVKARASSFRDVDRLELNRHVMVFDENEEVWVDTLRLEPGINRVTVSAFDIEGVEGGQDFMVPHLRPQYIDGAPSLPDPWRVGGHTATLLQDGNLLVTGGAARSNVDAYKEVFLLNRFADQFVQLDATLDQPRFGHTASLLPDGRVLILGGSTSSALLNASQLVQTAQVFDPATQSFSNIPFDTPSFLPPFRRANHVTFISIASGQVFVDIYGGRGPSLESSELILARDDIQTYALERDTLFFIDVISGVDGVPPAAGLSSTLLSSGGDLSDARYIVTGTRFLDTAIDSVNFTIDFDNIPIQVDPLPSLRVPRVQHASSPIENGFIFISGGFRGTDRTVLGSAETYFDPTKTFFSLDAALGTVPRRAHTATKLISGRILVLGGFDSNGQAISNAQYFTWR